MGISPDTELLVRAMFPVELVPDALEVVGWYDDVQAEDVHQAVLLLCKGDIDVLLDLVAAAATDFRDVLMWASLPEPTQRERAAARSWAEALVRERAEARRRYLETTYGAKGAQQIERSNKKLFGMPSPPGPERDAS